MANRPEEHYTYYYIYKTINLINGKIYVGQRVTNKLPEKDRYLGSGTHFTNAKKKHGIENFKKEILEICDKVTLNEREIYWIAFLCARDNNIGYNHAPGGEGMGSGEDNPNWHIPRPDSVKSLISDGLIGVAKSENHKKNISLGKKGKGFSDEHINNLSLARMGKEPWNKGTKGLTVPWNKGLTGVYSEELLSLMSENGKKIVWTDKKRENLRIGKKNQKIVTCPHCGYESNNNIIYKNHFNNCRFKPALVALI